MGLHFSLAPLHEKLNGPEGELCHFLTEHNQCIINTSPSNYPMLFTLRGKHLCKITIHQTTTRLCQNPIFHPPLLQVHHQLRTPIRLLTCPTSLLLLNIYLHLRQTDLHPLSTPIHLLPYPMGLRSIPIHPHTNNNIQHIL
jgi:hypothetical protein